MYNSLKMSLSFIILFIFSLGAVQADCIVTTKNFSNSSRVIYVNPTNGSDQLAKIYNYNLGNQRNPYDPKRIVAFQNLDEALATRNTRNGDLVLIKTGRIWTRYDDWSKNKSSEFNKQSAQASGYSQRQCQGENLTWVPSAVTDTQSADTAPATEFSNTNDITIANTEIVTSRNTTPNQVATAPQSKNSPTTPRRSSGGSSSGGSSSGSNTSSPISDNTLDPQQNESTSYSRGNTRFQLPTNDTTPIDEVIADLDPSITDEVVDEEVNPVESDTDNGYIAECTVGAPWEYSIKKYPQDSKGWSIIKPDSETRIVYVSTSDGSDSLARPYMSEEISDPFKPSSSIQPYKSVEVAVSQLREGKPDWLLFKKGDRFELEKTISLTSGKSPEAHIVLSAYGDNDKRPLIDSKDNTGIKLIKNRNYITIVGLEFYASHFDPKSPDFVGWGNAKNSIAGFASISGDVVSGFFLENNRFNFYKSNIVFSGEGPNNNIVIRRNEIMNAYSESSHSQGMYIGRGNYVLIEENIFDHNGWYQQRPADVKLNTTSKGYATIFNHNAYIADTSNMIVRKNLFSRSSSIGLKLTANADKDLGKNSIRVENQLMIDNIIINGEVGFSVTGNTTFRDGYRWKNINLIGNVLSNIGETQPTNRNLSWHIEIEDWDLGTVCQNDLLNQMNPVVKNVVGIKARGDNKDVKIKNNNIIDLGLAEVQLKEENNIDVDVNGNAHLETEQKRNFLSDFLTNNGYHNYDSYINSVLSDLKQNNNEYYRIDDLLEHLKSKSSKTRLEN